MQIKVENKVSLKLPTGLALNSLTACLAPSFFKKYGLNLTRKQCLTLVKALNRYRKAHPEWVLVEVEDHKGEQIRIRL